MAALKNLTIAACLGLVLWDSPAAWCQTPISFNSQIRPILSDYCFACHGPDEETRAADLRLDQREPAVDYGAIVEGEPGESLLIERIESDDPDMLMPPPETGKTLTTAQKELLAEWIRQGGEYQKHWSFEPLPETVSIPESVDDWPRTSVDAFVAQTHREKGFQPNGEADKATWLRRVTFDLTGLPPTLPELDAFLADASDDAYENVVQRLLTSPAYGERMAVMWLDIARYADTFGYQNDIPMEVWPWRQWVIEAFNRNLPYDQFITEQLAGDLIPGATVSQRLATTFNRLHRQTNEGGSVVEEFRLTGITDRTTTAGTALLGLTMECCRCHDHKFDPIKQKEFYQLSAYFSDIDEFGLYSHFTFSAPTPAMLLYEGDQQQRHAAAKQAIAEAEASLEAAIQAGRQQWRSRGDAPIETLPEPREPAFVLPLEGTVVGVVGKATVCNGDDAIECKDAPRFGRTDEFSYSLWVRPASQGPRMMVLHQSRAAEDAAFRGVELTLDEGHPQFSMIHFWPGNALRVRAVYAIPSGDWTHLAVTHDGSGRADGVQLFINGQRADVEVIRDKLTRDVRQRNEWGDLDVDKVTLALGARFRDIGFRGGSVDDLKVFDLQLSSAEVLSIFAAAQPEGDPPNLDDGMALQHHLLTADETVAQARRRLANAREVENELVTAVREIMTMRHDENAPPTHVLGRGEYTNKQEQVSPGTPELAGGLPDAGDDRLSLAEWMTDPQNPLTSRVIANRMWHLFFGRGIVVTLEDFGSQGTPPSHPELLDHLARSLMDNDWDLHWLCREIVLSSTYRQSSKVDDPSVYERDRDNTWLTRGPKHRLSAEQLRDTVLAASGLLVKKIGGPSVMPYQPAGLWRESGTGKSYNQSTGDGLYRRSLYTFWKRTAPPPTMLTLDATSRESCTPRRELTTTPLQALVFLNDPQYVEASRVLAESLVQTYPADRDARWNELFRRLLSRLPHDRERTVINQLYDEQQAYFSENESDAGEFLNVGARPLQGSAERTDLAATTIVVQALFAYDETIMLR
ncbi:Planctomycete cytochrome C [Stieleria neptunia]|uniref:Planctomycete cytochrome C n=1 Tax=Stieleria neptunia TaxID=2527979 RepID=A0A518HJL9_9BACT|nr:DUF1553 domain-containing protein [Stieleria neptunia]QDV41042.1 Planctomycete cytochrome C [Stieleria neptunia]